MQSTASIRTARDIDRARPGQKLKAGRPGLYLHVGKSGSRSWILKYRGAIRADGKPTPRSIRIGEYPAMGLAEARTRADVLRGQILEGHDPMSRKQARREEQRALAQEQATRESFADAFKRYLRTTDVQQYKQPQIEAALLGYIAETRVGCQDFGELAVLDVTDEQIADLQEALNRRGLVLSNRCMRALSRFDTWARTPRGVPGMAVRVHRLTATIKLNKEAERDRSLDDQELAAVVQACRTPDPRHGALILLLLLTGLRSGEAQGLRWRPDPAGQFGHVDLAARRIVLPAGATKNGEPHEVHLSELALDTLRQLPDHYGGDFIFGSDGRHYPRNLRQKAQAVVQAASGTSNWTPHDLRRTFATSLQRLGVAETVIQKCLNHTLRGPLKIYARYAYWPERVQALEAWSQRVQELFTNDNAAGAAEGEQQ